MSVQQQNLSSTQEIYKKISKFVPEAEWKIHAPLIEKIGFISGFRVDGATQNEAKRLGT